MSAAVEADKPIIIRLTHNSQYGPPSIHELTTNIWPSMLAGGYDFTAEKILQIDNTAKSISTVKVVIGTYNDPDAITVNLYTYTFS